MDPNKNNMIISSSADDYIPPQDYSPQPRSRKPIIIVAIVIVLLALGAAVSFLLSRDTTPAPVDPENSSTTPETDVVYDIKREYATLEEQYEYYIGLTPSLTYTESSILFPISTGQHSQLSAQLKKLKDMLKSAENEKGIDSIRQNIDAINANVNIIANFLNAFFTPLKDISTPTQCTETSQISKLLNSDTGSIRAAAQSFYIAYCQVTPRIFTQIPQEDLQTLLVETKPYYVDATAKLNQTLSSIDKIREGI